MTLESTIFGTLPFELFAASFIYMILALQVGGGFPPFYKTFNHMPSEEELKPLALIGFLIMALLTGAVAMNTIELLFGAAAAACWAALLMRSRLRDETNGVLSWLIHPVTLKWPMIVFDAWTLGLTALFLLITVSV